MLWLICSFLLWQEFLNQSFMIVGQFTQVITVTYFIPPQLLNTLSSQQDADMHETTEVKTYNHA